MKKNIYENDFDKVVAQINKATEVEGRGGGKLITIITLK